MRENLPLNGSCLCGAVWFSAKQTSAPHACHCQMCRQHHGAPFHSVPCTDLMVTSGEESLQIYNSSKWAHRGFCQECGSGLFYRTHNHEFMGVSLGSIDTERPKLARHLYTDCADVDENEQPDFWDDLPKMTAKEFLGSINLGALYDNHTPPIARHYAIEFHGGCSCGGVRFYTSGNLRPIRICHCGQCQKQTSSYYRSTSSANEDFHLVKSNTLKWYPSSETAERGFCERCGSVLFWRMTQSDNPADLDRVSIQMGVFDERLALPTEAHIFTEDASSPLPEDLS